MKKCNEQICLKLADTLRTALKAEAAAESRGLSNLIRKILLEHSTKRIIERASGADAGAHG
jgi:hypothetical protein